MNESAFRRALPEQSFGSGRTSGTPRHPSLIHPILSKRVCFYKSGDPQFNGLRMVINSRTFKTFDALLDSLSRKVPLPFGVRNITTPRGVHAVRTLDELEDGKSYICSDTRKVKPIDLALARKKPAPWYHARPVSPRRRSAQQARFFPGGNNHRQESVSFARTPKILSVFRNGDAGVKHSVVLHKRTTPTFESILECISELMQFQVVKLHAADGRRVDGFPGLILCSGTVVAAGREPFRPANYNAQISPAQSTSPTKQIGPRRPRALKRKKKSKPYTPKSRHFSLSSERYIVDRIHNSITGGPCDRPGHSVELESGHMLESVAETPDTGLCVAAGERDGRQLPSDDDIEKSFRVNQDGSMTVEMRVRLTIKEEETIHWTTTLARSSVASQLNATCSPETGPEQQINSLKSNSLDSESPASSINKDKTRDNNDEDPPSLGNGVLSESNNEEDPRSPPTPGHRHIRIEQASVEGVQSGAVEGIREGVVGSYSYREQAQSGAVTEQYCVVKQRSSRPVPKPRRQSSVDANNVNGRNVPTFKSAGMSEIQRIESSGGEVTETVLHVYEQQTCQDNFFANLCSQDMSAFGIPFCRPATSETGQLSSNEEFEPPPWRPSTASESISIWRAESTSVTSALNLPSRGPGAIQAVDAQQRLPKPTVGQPGPQQKEGNKDRRVSSKPKVINKRVRRLKLPGKKRKENSAGVPEKNGKVKTFTSAGFIKKIYGNKSKSVKSTMKLKKGPDRVTTGSSQQLDDTVKCVLKDLNVPLASKETTSETVSSEKGRLNVAPIEVSQHGGMLERQTSMHQEKKKENECCDVSESMSLPAFNSSSAVTKEYVESWLEKACLNPSAYSDEASKKKAALTFVQTENARCVESEKKKGLTFVADDEKGLEDTSGEPNGPLPQDELEASVKQRIRSFESKPSGQSTKKAAVKQQIVYSHETTTNTENYLTLARNNTDQTKPLVCCEIVPPINDTSTEIPPGIRVDDKSSTIQISFKKEAPSKELPTPVGNTDLPEYSMTGGSSEAGGLMPRLGSQTPRKHPLSVSRTSDRAESPADRAMETTATVHPDTCAHSAAPLPRTPSIKRAPLVSNKSLDRKMSLRKACLEKYTLCSDATSETSASSTPINPVGDNVVPNGVCSTGTQRPSEGRAEETQRSNSISDVRSSPSCGTSASPASSTSEERMSSSGISSSLAPTPSDLSLKDTKTDKTHSFPQKKEAMSPQPLVKSVKHSSPSPGRKSPSEPQNSPELSSFHNHPPDAGLHQTSNAGSSTERKLNRPKSHRRRSPYSQSLDMASSPVKHKAAGRRRHKTPRATNSAAEQQTATGSALASLDVDRCDESKTADDPEEPVAQIVPRQLNTVNQANMKPVLETICYSIKSIRRITQNKRPSCLEKSNSLPDFSSHVASTFGSSSQALLAFLSVMTLKEGLDDMNMDKLDANNVSCAEALKMIDSLRKIASIDDSQELKASLSSLQRSASKQLLQSWKGFQDLSDKHKSPTPNDSEPEAAIEAVSGCRVEETVVGEIVDSLDIPERLKEELNCLSKVKINSDDEEPTERAKTKNNSNAEISKFSTDYGVSVGDVAKDDKDDVDVSSIIKKFTDVNQPKQSNAGGRTKDSRDKDSLGNGSDKCPPAHPTNKHTPEGKQLCSSALFAEDNEHNGVKSNQDQAQANGVVSGYTILAQDTGASDAEEHDGDRLQVHGEASASGSELRRCEEEEGRRIPRAAKDLEREALCQQSVSVSEAGEQHSSEDEGEVEWGSDEDKQATSDYDAELDVRRKDGTSSRESHHKPLSEEELPEVACQSACTGSNSSVDESTCDPDVDDPSSEEEQPEVEGMRLKVIFEESVLGSEEEEEEHLDYLPDHMQPTRKYRESKALMEETEEDSVSSHEEGRDADETHVCDTVEGDPSHFILNQDSYILKDKSSCIKSDILTQMYGLNEDEDSGNDHSSCEQHAETEQPKDEGKPPNTSSYEDKESCSSEEEGVHIDRYTEDSCTEYQGAPPHAKDTTREKAVEIPQHQTEGIISQSVAARVILLEKQVAVAQKTTESSATRRSSQRKAPLGRDEEDSPSESPASRPAAGAQSPPQSSLSFSYDSSGVVTSEPEGHRVRSIREMFLAKAATDVQHRCLPSSKTSEARAETSASGGYQTQTSSEPSSSEDDSARRSITKGFVRRTIERLYGKKDARPDQEAGGRPPSAPKQQKQEHLSAFSPFHVSRSKAMSEFSYFNSTHAVEPLSDATRCVAFNAELRPEDNEQWFLREKALIRKSASEPVAINKGFTNSQGGEMCEDAEEDPPYSLFSTKSELEDNQSSLSRKCTYFSLPHTSDSDAHLEESSAVSRTGGNGQSAADTKEDSQDAGTRAERGGALPAVADFKRKDNKVHPATEPPPDGEVVLVQPGKRQGVMSRRVEEPDVLDILYNFCGQNCPIL
uniref:uncharacterized protein LOC120811973 n=1 Tax=Gasterosteus aculeatus aculeatus TaxID=481459 RepID=UPI001A98A893|nr:uncharacterized protein LOC120811973 [Gasterosteus aculeatus aculeatus]